MLEKGKISSIQAIMLMISMILPTAVLTVPAITVKSARQDAWFSIIIATMAGLLIAWMVVNLGLRFPEKTLFEYIEDILGKIPGKILGFLYIWWFLHMNALVIREYGVFLATAVMPDTPIIIFHIVVVAVAAYAVRNGLEVLSRANQLLIPTTVLLALVFILSIPNMKLSRVLPLFDAGLFPIVKGAVVPASWLGEIVTFAMIIPYLSKPKEAYRVAFLSILLVSFFLTTSILEALLIFGPNLTGSWIFPTFNAVRMISVGNSLGRLEIIIVLAWVLGGFFKIGVFYYAAVLGSAQWLKLKNYQPLVLPVGIILVALSILIHDGIVDLLDFLKRVWPPYALIVFEAGIPLVLLIIAVVGRKGGRKIA
ncbi:MAG: spore germination protein [Clostridia bacterium]|jgi:spore germination protein KB|nr:spore germination protein [Clostridia bacterium]MDN5322118.1 spore germination protein [Clostridia bacterium]